MKTYKVYFRDGSFAEFDASRFENDGSGTRFYGDDGQLIASFYDGEVRRVLPKSASVQQPATEE